MINKDQLQKIWFNIADYEDRFRPNTFFIGGRRIGKTFSTFSYMYERQPFLYVRNTEVQIDECCGDFGNPFKKWNKVTGHNIHLEKEKKHAVILDGAGEDEHVVGYAASCSNIGAIRGADLSDFKIGLYDEFIEKKPLQYDQARFYNDMYESINSNRELEGEKAFTMFLLSNSQKLANSILAEKDLITPIENMMKTGQKTWSRGDCFICLPVSEVSELKKETAFYKGREGSKNYEEALNNRFANDSFFAIAKRPLKEYIGVCMIDGIYIYKHKSNGKYYACFTQCLNVPTFSSKDNFSIFYRTYGRQFDIMAASGLLECCDFTCKSRLYDILKI